MSRKKLSRMLTLTLDARKLASVSELAVFFEHLEEHKPKKTACRCETCTRLQVRSIKHIKNCWAKLRIYLKRRFGVAPTYIAVLEFQKSTGFAHLHIVIDRYIDHAWARKAWQAVGGGQHVHIEEVNTRNTGAYLSKYLSKEMIQSAPLRVRRVTTSADIRLNEKMASELDWQICKSPIDRVYVLLREVVASEVRTDGELDSFTVRE
jgi:hypothetical protein